jgi:nitrogen regulatory protein PII
MKLKLIIAFLPDARLEEVLEAARAMGVTGSTIITSARGEGLERERKFLGLELASHRNLALWLVEADVAADVLREIAAVGRFETERGAGIACQIDVEEAVGLMRQIKALEGSPESRRD